MADGKTSPFDGSGGAGGQAMVDQESRQQQSGSDPVNPNDKADGPPTAAEVATPQNDRGGQLGTIADRAVHKPFKIGGQGG